MAGPFRGLSLRGHPFGYFERTLPPIPEQLLQSVIYLYPSVEEAEAGGKVGGTGFLVEWAHSESGLSFICAVSNNHVVRGHSNSHVVRLNTVEGATDVLPLPSDAWVQHEGGDDIAVAPIGLSPEYHRFACIKRESFLTVEQVVGEAPPGIEAFFLGRFRTHQGRSQNRPTVRFGNLAMSPPEMIASRYGGDQESFLVEARSLPGYSGSPVFVYRLSGETFPGTVTTGIGKTHLLGIDWSHLRDWLPVMRKTPNGLEETDDLMAQQHTGMMGVVPAWKLAELLDSEKVRGMAERAQSEDRARTEHVALDVADNVEDDEYKRFENLTQKLVNVPKKKLDAEREGES